MRDLGKSPSSHQTFAYEVSKERGPERGVGVIVKEGESYSIVSNDSGPCAVYAAVLTPSPTMRVEWGEHVYHVDANNRFYYGARDLAWPPLSTVDSRKGSRKELYGLNPAGEGEEVAQEVLLGVGDFKDGALTLQAAGDVRLTHVRFRKLTAEEYELAKHENSPAENKTVIYNNDGYSAGFIYQDWEPEKLLEQIDVYANTDVKQLDFAALVTGVVSYPSKYADWLGDKKIYHDDWEWTEVGIGYASENFRKLEESGTPLYPTLVKRGKELGISVWGSLRMSGYYGIRESGSSYGHEFNGRLWKEHPEYIMKSKGGSDMTVLSLAYKAVREQRLGVLTELAEMGCDGVNLDFCRYPEVIGYDQPLIDGFRKKYGRDPRSLPDDDRQWFAYQSGVVTQLLRDLRERLAPIGKERGKPVQISVRLPAEDYKKYGFDPETWIKEGLVDLLIVSGHPLETPFDVRPWRKMVEGSKVSLYANIEHFIYVGGINELTEKEKEQGLQETVPTEYTQEDYIRRTAMLYDEGADGVYIFNNFGSKIGLSLNKLGDRRWIKRWSEFEDRLQLGSEIVKVTKGN